MADIDVGANKVTNLAAGAAVSDAVRLDQVVLPPEHISGLILSNNGTDADHDIDVATGAARDVADSADMKLTSTLTKQIDAVWAVGTNQGGLDTGTVAADTTYAVWLIKRSDTGVVDALFSTSFSSPTMPTSYDKKRLIGFVVTDSVSNIIAFTQVGDYFRFIGDVVLDITDTTMTNEAFEVGTLSVPPNSIAEIYVRAQDPADTLGEVRMYVKTNGAGDNSQKSEATMFLDLSGGATFEDMTARTSVLVDGSSQIQYAIRVSGAGEQIDISTFGCHMLTRSNPV